MTPKAAIKHCRTEKPLDTAIARHIWDNKYRWRESGTALEHGIEDTWRRVARTLASAERGDPEGWERRFYQTLEGFKFLPGGRIVAGAGVDRQVTLFN